MKLLNLSNCCLGRVDTIWKNQNLDEKKSKKSDGMFVKLCNPIIKINVYLTASFSIATCSDLGHDQVEESPGNTEQPAT
jgi:hypothetical protein